MNSDIRIAVTFIDHLKTIKLQRRHGADAVLCLIRLWCYTAQNRPDGVLTGMDEEDIEIASKWAGEAGAFVSALREIGWLEEVQPVVYAINDWAEHQPYVVHAPERKERARRAAAAKHAKSMLVADSEHAGSMPEGCLSAAPSPSPVPSPEPNPKALAPLGAFDRFWSAYPKKKSKGDAEKTWKKLRPDEQLQDRIHRALEQAKTSADWKKDGGQFIPYPASWLNAKGWEDDYGPNVLKPKFGGI